MLLQGALMLWISDTEIMHTALSTLLEGDPAWNGPKTCRNPFQPKLLYDSVSKKYGRSVTVVLKPCVQMD